MLLKIAVANFDACVLNIVLNIILLPRIGLVGAAIATMVSYGGIVVFWRISHCRCFLTSWSGRHLRAMRLWAAQRPYWWRNLPIETPLFSALIKGSLILLVYIGTLFAIDGRVRMLLAQAWVL